METQRRQRRRQTLNPAAERMFKWILSSDLAPGDPIPIEQDLATQFGMARGTVREAVRELPD
jgi:GntR family transcriptional repressor for pyruvate dehydrogenase complex